MATARAPIVDSGETSTSDEPTLIESATARPIVEARDRVRVVFLSKRRELDIVSGLKAHTAKNDRVATNTQREETFAAIGTMIGCYGADTEREAGANGCRAVNTDVDFHATIRQTAEFLLT